MKNKLKDLNNYLFLQLEKLSDEEIVEDRYQKFRRIGEFVTLN